MPRYEGKSSTARWLIAAAWRQKQMLGGAMRQSGIVAAAALYALEHNVERLAEDHDNAGALAAGLAGMGGIEIDPTACETNIVVFTVADAPGLIARLAQQGIEMGALSPTVVRAVTHLDVGPAEIERAVEAVAASL